MKNHEHTQTSPFAPPRLAPRALLGLTILWHPEHRSIGAQAIGPAGAGVLALGRHAPSFYCLDASQVVLANQRIARAPLLLERHDDDSVSITAPTSRMTVLVDGLPLRTGVRLAPERLGRGVVLELGATVLVCLHWMQGLPKSGGASPLLGVSDGAIKLRDLVRQVAATSLPVLLLGETGTGKEVAARAIHAASARCHAPWVSVNMAALNEALAAADLFGAEKGAYTGAQQARPGLFAEALDGTLFLDEIGDTPAAIQPMLLRVLESGEYRPLGARANRISAARLIAATDQDLQARAFNQALLRRLEAFVIRLPPLRERRPDIGLLMVAELAGRTLPALPLDLVSAMCRYDWPGNVRQLLNVVRRLALGHTADVGVVFDMLVAAPAGTEKHDASADKAVRRRLDDVSDGEVLAAMAAGRWRVQGAARWLGISRPSMYKLLAQHPQIRQPEAIDDAELAAALALHADDLERCAALLRTPIEALRRSIGVRAAARAST